MKTKIKVPKQYIRTIKKECWSCGIKEHIHYIERAAAACIAKQEKMGDPPIKYCTKEEHMVRDYELFDLIVRGATFSEMAKKFDRHITTIRQHFHWRWYSIRVKMAEAEGKRSWDLPDISVKEMRENPEYWIDLSHALTKEECR